LSIVLIYDSHDLVLPDFDLDLAAPPREFAIPATTPDGFDIVAFCDRKGARVCFAASNATSRTWKKRRNG
jgi:hypothetical protein